MTDTSITRASFNLALAAVGWGAVGLGTAGLFIPGLPTTVFVLIAFYCFSKSSPHFAHWLLEHPWLGPSLRPHLAEARLVQGGEARGPGRDVDVDSGVINRAAPHTPHRGARHDRAWRGRHSCHSGRGADGASALDGSRGAAKEHRMTPYAAVDAIERDTLIPNGPGDAFSGTA